MDELENGFNDPFSGGFGVAIVYAPESHSNRAGQQDKGRADKCLSFDKAPDPDGPHYQASQGAHSESNFPKHKDEDSYQGP